MATHKVVTTTLASSSFIDDVQHNVDAAEAHGWTGIWFESHQQLRQHLVVFKLL
ncbi:hypothetical protein [Limnohabitans sp. Rim11]|uniref:hypothetical protein n=1 Tax=Limnohabitans sp. Rim11 TaxID=1100719 RepID=UPI000A43E8C8|nr:hypothetical protein [Limnohabitans sp. Rim11]